MKFIESGGDLPMHIIELTERNLLTLLEKLTDPNSARTLMDPDLKIMVKAVPDAEHYSNRAPGEVFTNGEFK